MNISIHALREEGDRSSTTKAPTGTISIHALREEGDGCKLRNLRDVEAISIHALREEGDRAGLPESAGRKDFYPRPPRGGRHGRAGGVLLLDLFLSTPSARRATGKNHLRPSHRPISIHALREEGNRALTGTSAVVSKFLSTPSARRATRTDAAQSAPCWYFYPRPPRGGRQRHWPTTGK